MTLMEPAAGARLHAAMRRREPLRAPFRQAWERVARTPDAAALEAWAEGALALLHANAGAGCLAALFRLSAGGLAADPALLGRVAQAAAETCRHAGAAAARACLEASGRLAARGAGADAELWWRGLRRLAREAPECVAPLAAQAETVLGALDPHGFVDFVALGLKACGRDRACRHAFFTLAHPLARRALDGAGAATGFSGLERGLKLFAAALWGPVPALRALPAAAGRPPPRRASLADAVVLLPAVFPGVSPAAQAALFRAAVAHATAHLAFGAGRQPVGSLRPAQLALVGLVEDARVEALALRRFPGLRRLWAPFHVAIPEGGTAPALLARVARALFDPLHADPHGFVVKARALFEAAADRLEDAALSRRIGGLLGNDLGQMRVRFDARSYVIEPAYRDDGLGLWDFGEQPEAPPDLAELMVEAARLRQEAGESGEREDAAAPPQAAPRARPTPAGTEGLVLARYPEWDRVQGVERPDWTCVREIPAPAGDPRRIAEALDATPDLRRHVDRLVRAARPGRPRRLKRQPDGMELDMDAVLDSVAAQAAGEVPDGRLYRSSALRLRDLATVVLVDVSEFTRDRVGAASVLDLERSAVALLGEAMQRMGDPFALLAFASDGREQVRLRRLKDFSEPFGTAPRARLAGLAPGLSTRLGAALRHAGAELAGVRSFRKLVLVLSDGEPSDIDADPLDLVEDFTPRGAGAEGARHRRVRGDAGRRRRRHGGAHLRARRPGRAAPHRGFAGAAVDAVFSPLAPLSGPLRRRRRPVGRGERQQARRSLVPWPVPQRCAARSLGMPSMGHSSVPTVGRVMASTISRVPFGSAIQRW